MLLVLVKMRFAYLVGDSVVAEKVIVIPMSNDLAWSMGCGNVSLLTNRKLILQADVFHSALSKKKSVKKTKQLKELCNTYKRQLADWASVTIIHNDHLNIGIICGREWELKKCFEEEATLTLLFDEIQSMLKEAHSVMSRNDDGNQREFRLYRFRNRRFKKLSFLGSD